MLKNFMAEIMDITDSYDLSEIKKNYLSNDSLKGCERDFITSVDASAIIDYCELDVFELAKIDDKEGSFFIGHGGSIECVSDYMRVNSEVLDCDIASDGYDTITCTSDGAYIITFDYDKANIFSCVECQECFSVERDMSRNEDVCIYCQRVRDERC